MPTATINPLVMPERLTKSDYRSGHDNANVEISLLGTDKAFFDSFDQLITYYNAKTATCSIYTPHRILSYWQGYGAALLMHQLDQKERELTK